jgi:uncharacterized membrane protein
MVEEEGKGAKRLILVGPKSEIDLMASWLIVSLAVALSLIGDRSSLLAVLAFITTYFIVGYAAQAAFFPERTVSLSTYRREITLVGDSANIIERLALSVVFSLVLVALGGILMLWSPFGFTDLGALLMVLLLTYGFTGLAWYRRSRLPREEQFSLVLNIGRAKTPLNILEKVVSVVIIAAIVVAGVMMVVNMGQSGSIEPYTELSLLDSNGKLVDLPQHVPPGVNWTVQIVVTNHMQRDMLYNLTVGLSVNGSFQSYHELNTSQATSLNTGEGWTSQQFVTKGSEFIHNLQFSISVEGLQKVYFHLKAIGVDQDVWLWLDVGPL